MITRNLIIIILLCFIIKSCASVSHSSHKADGTLPKVGALLTNSINKFDSIIRLETLNGNFYCSGFVIDGNYAITAGHCVRNSIGGISSDEIAIYDKDNNSTGITAVPIAMDNDRDIGFIKGNFIDFKSMNVDFTGEHVRSNSLIKSCGFPAGQKDMYCTDLIMNGNMNFQYKTYGLPLYKGMSGGPAIDVNSGYVIGVNSAVGEDSIIIGPLIGVLENVRLR